MGFLPYPLAADRPLDPSRWPLLVDAADRLMYLAKQRGRARACGVVRVWRSPPTGDDEELLRRLSGEPAAPPAGLDLVEVLAS